MSSRAVAAWSTTLTWNGTEVAELQNITGPMLRMKVVDVSDMDSTFNKFIPSLIDGGQITIDGNFTNEAGQSGLRADFLARTPRTVVITLPPPLTSTWTATAYCITLEEDHKVTDRVTFKATFQISGTPVFDAGSSAGGSPAVLQMAQGYTATGVSTITVAFPNPVTSGSLLVAFAYVENSLGPAATISDTLTNTWTSARVEGSSPGLWDSAAAAWHCISAGGGADSLTVLGSGTNLLLLQIYEVTGTNGTLRTSGHNSAAGSGGSSSSVSTAVASGGLGPAQAGDYAMSFLWTGTGTAGSPFTAGPGYTLQQQQVTPVPRATATETGIVSADGDVTATFTMTGTAPYWGEYLLVFGHP